MRRMTAPLIAGLAARLASPDAARARPAARVGLSGRFGRIPYFFFARNAFSRRGSSNESSSRDFRPSTVNADGVTLRADLARLARTDGRRSAASWSRSPEFPGWRCALTWPATLLRDNGCREHGAIAGSFACRYFDTPVVEFVGSLPDDARRRPGAQKALLVEALGDLLPQELLTQWKTNVHPAVGKRGCRGPAGARGWMQALPTLRRLLAAYLRPGGVRSVWRDFPCRENHLVAPPGPCTS